MPGFDDTEAITAYPTEPKGTFRVPTVVRADGFDVRFEAEAGKGVIAGGRVTPYEARLLIRNLSTFKAVAFTAPLNAKGDIGVGKTWNTNDQLFVFQVPANSPDIKANDLLEVIGVLETGNPPGGEENDFSFVRSEIFLVI